MSEHAIQNRIRNALAGLCILFRANVGKGWTSSQPAEKTTRTRTAILQPGDVILRAARPFDTGLPAGFSDTFGVVKVEVTADMVGDHIGVAMFGEVKDEKGRVSPLQTAFLAAMKNQGARVGIWRSPEDALATVRGEGLNREL